MEDGSSGTTDDRSGGSFPREQARCGLQPCPCFPRERWPQLPYHFRQCCYPLRQQQEPDSKDSDRSIKAATKVKDLLDLPGKGSNFGWWLMSPRQLRPWRSNGGADPVTDLPLGNDGKAVTSDGGTTKRGKLVVHIAAEVVGDAHAIEVFVFFLKNNKFIDTLKY